MTPTLPHLTRPEETMATHYEVYQPSHPGPDRVQSGTTISRHRTPFAAVRRIARANARLRRQPGMAQSWLDYDIRAVEAGTRRALDALEAVALLAGEAVFAV